MKKIDIQQLDINVSKYFDKNWALVTAGSLEDANTMTVAWGSLGYLWKKNVCTIYIRPTRHTYKYIENSQYFSVSFLSEKYRNDLIFCGRNSGRDVNKFDSTNLSLTSLDDVVAIAEAEITIICKKIYADDFDNKLFLDPSIEKNYPLKDYHRFYIGEVIACYIK